MHYHVQPNQTYKVWFDFSYFDFDFDLIFFNLFIYLFYVIWSSLF